jgi:pyruvate/2-oxoacid:ferredoxin oxidoreductase beta subunit
METHISPQSFDMPAETDIAWCPGCGNFPLLTIVKMALAELDIASENLVSVSGIGQAGKAPHYYSRTSALCGNRHQDGESGAYGDC